MAFFCKKEVKESEESRCAGFGLGNCSRKAAVIMAVGGVILIVLRVGYVFGKRALLKTFRQGEAEESGEDGEGQSHVYRQPWASLHEKIGEWAFEHAADCHAGGEQGEGDGSESHPEISNDHPRNRSDEYE